MDANWRDTLNRMFLPTKQWGKPLIPCGVHVLKCTKCEWRVGKMKRYLYVELWKRPEYHPYAKEAVSYGKIKLFHIPTLLDDPKENWYDRFTTTLNEHFLEHLRERLSTRPKFKAVIGRREVERAEPTVGGYIYSYYWENYIRSVHRIDEEIVLTNEDYFDLYKPFEDKKQSTQPLDLPQVEDEVPF